MLLHSQRRNLSFQEYMWMAAQLFYISDTCFAIYNSVSPYVHLQKNTVTIPCRWTSMNFSTSYIYGSVHIQLWGQSQKIYFAHNFWLTVIFIALKWLKATWNVRRWNFLKVTACLVHLVSFIDVLTNHKLRWNKVHEYLKTSNIYKLYVLQYLKNFTCSKDKSISINVIVWFVYFSSFMHLVINHISFYLWTASEPIYKSTINLQRK
jgi:hypothetical protein